MKIMLDTNILYSLFFLNSNYLRGWLLQLYCDHNIDIFWDDYSITEFINAVYRQKKIGAEEFHKYVHMIEDISFPNFAKIIYSANVGNIYRTRDVKDDRLLNSAIINKMDYLITRDKDLLECSINKISILTPEQFWVSYKNLS